VRGHATLGTVLASLLIEQLLKRITNPTFLTFRRIAMKIQDLSKELSHEDRAVRGGGAGPIANVGLMGGSQFDDTSGFRFASPDTNLAINTLPQINVAPTVTTLDVTKLTDVLGSLGTSIKQ
jgi:hypothetical protein